MQVGTYFGVALERRRLVHGQAGKSLDSLVVVVLDTGEERVSYGARPENRFELVWFAVDITPEFG